MKNLKRITVIVVLMCVVVLLVGCTVEKTPEKIAEKAAEVEMTPTEARVRCLVVTNKASVWVDSSVSAIPYGEMPDMSVTYGINRVLIFGEFHEGEYRRYDTVGIYVEDLEKLGVIQDFPEGIKDDTDGIIWFRDGEATPY